MNFQKLNVEQVDMEALDFREEDRKVSQIINKAMFIENEVKNTKACRQALDKVLQEIKQLDKCREVILAITKVQEGMMWLDVNLKRLNTLTPYPENYNPNNT